MRFLRQDTLALCQWGLMTHLISLLYVYLPIFIPPLLMLALSKGPGGHQEIESQRQLDGHPTSGMTQRIPFSLGPPRFEYDTPAITVRVLSPHLQAFLAPCTYSLS